MSTTRAVAGAAGGSEDVEPVDLIVRDVSVVTMDPRTPRATAVAVRGDRIVALSAEVPLRPGGCRIEGRGLTLIPGLIDAHCHLRAVLAQDLAVRCRPPEVASIAELTAAIGRRAAELPPGTWIRAEGYNPFVLAEGRHPTRQDLDAAAPHHPVRLRHVSRHASVLNTAALARAGIGPRTADPAGARVERQPGTGEPTGLVYGADAWLSRHVVPPLDVADLRTASRRVQARLVSRGITAVQDATATNTVDEWRFWETETAAGWPVHVTLMSGPEHHESLVAEAVRSGDHPRLAVGPVKVMLEATDLPSAGVIERAVAGGTAAAVHVVEPEMLWTAIEAFRSARPRGLGTGTSGPRTPHRLEHLSLCPDVLLPAIAELGLMVVTNPAFIVEHGDRYRAEVPAEEQPWLYRQQSLLRAGIPLAAGSDAPVATSDPWVGIQAACERRTASGALVGGAERLDRLQALALYTSAAAAAGGQAGRRGVIQPGVQADLVLVDRDPLACPVDELSATQVQFVIIGGRIAHGPGTLLA